jgi:hypothetical protein
MRLTVKPRAATWGLHDPSSAGFRGTISGCARACSMLTINDPATGAMIAALELVVLVALEQDRSWTRHSQPKR